MLAQNFQSPAALGISDVEFEALVTVLGMLERGEIEHANLSGANLPKTIALQDGAELKKFNMTAVALVADCGAVGCLLGWARSIAGKKIFPDASLKRNPANSLFFDPCINTNITPAQAALALRSYLTTGEPHWAEALA